MNKIFKALSMFVLLVGLAGLSFGQTAPSTTTFSSAVKSTDTTVVLTSVTGILAAGPLNNYNTIIYVDREAMAVLTVNSTTKQVTVLRGWASTAARAHNTAATVYYSVPGQFGARELSGSCTSANELYLPFFNVVTGNIFYCLDGTWIFWASVTEMQLGSGRFTYGTVPIGSVAYSSFGNATTNVAGTLYCADVYIGRNVTLTGIAVLNAGTVGTDKGLVALYSPGGTLLANSATAGATTTGANAFQKYNFTATVNVYGPGDYYACYQPNGTTDNFRTVAVSTFIDSLTTSSTGTFGTVPATITVPTTFTANVGPIGYVY